MCRLFKGIPVASIELHFFHFSDVVKSLGRTTDRSSKYWRKKVRKIKKKTKNNRSATLRLKSLSFFRRDVVLDWLFRPILVLGEVSIGRNKLRRNVIYTS